MGPSPMDKNLNDLPVHDKWPTHATALNPPNTDILQTTQKAINLEANLFGTATYSNCALELNSNRTFKLNWPVWSSPVALKPDHSGSPMSDSPSVIIKTVNVVNTNKVTNVNSTAMVNTAVNANNTANVNSTAMAAMVNSNSMARGHNASNVNQG
ncbi:hypothetical protein N0V85_006036 [Neurospora sp. IMI 360204]|nr:hypothetical protein N0V85_006036 [Neurospora sp. IMI 360204]